MARFNRKIFFTIRTTDDYHVESVQKIFKQLYEQGDIYKGKYVGKYCKPCESFWTETQLKDGKCPDCGRDVVDAEEEAYFFRLSKYADKAVSYTHLDVYKRQAPYSISSVLLWVWISTKALRIFFAKSYQMSH